MRESARQHGESDEVASGTPAAGDDSPPGNFPKALGTWAGSVLKNYLSLLVTAVMHLGRPGSPRQN
jgi:hypothetical protein